MSVTLATVADALIEFILSLLRDPDAAEEFDKEPATALANHGLSNVTAADVCAVAPVVAESHSVAPNPSPKPYPPEPNPVVREIKQIVQNITWVDDRDTIVDQSVNQNIWAKGDVTQHFDQKAVVASGDESMAAGEDIDIENNLDQSTNFTAGEDVNVGNETEVVVISESFNEATDSSTDVAVSDSLNEESTDVSVDESFNDVDVASTETTVDADVNYIDDSEFVVVDDQY